MGTGKKTRRRPTTAPIPFGVGFGQRVRSAREQAGMSQLELAHRTGMRPPTLCELEKGRNPVGPTGETIGKLADALGVSVSVLMQHE